MSELEDLPGAGAFLIAVGLGFLAFVIALNSLPRLAAAGRVPLSRAAEDKVHELAFIVGAAVFGLILGLLIAYANG